MVIKNNGDLKERINDLELENKKLKQQRRLLREFVRGLVDSLDRIDYYDIDKNQKRKMLSMLGNE